MNGARPDDLTWVAAAPLWKGVVQDRSLMRRPALLRFTSDAFMEELFTVLASKTPEDLAKSVTPPEPGGATLKLYQPVHGQFHLVAASLVCQRPGLPDHPIDTTREEKASFVLRRVVGDDELAWIPPIDSSHPGSWQVVAHKDAITDKEELLALFPATFLEGDRRRRLHFGLVPTSSREMFHAAEVTDPAKVTDDGEVVLKLEDKEASDAALAPKLGSRAGALFTIRCVYRSPRCEPRERPVLSDRSALFTIGSYVDPDAPARIIRIPMPVDVSVEALKKFKKSVGFVLSNQLRKQLSRIDDPKKALKGEADPNGDNLDLGEIWVFAIPIITMVAMIILMIIASLLNMIFMWLPFLKIRIPIKLKG